MSRTGDKDKRTGGKDKRRKDERRMGRRLAALHRLAFGGRIEVYLTKVVIGSALVAVAAYLCLSPVVTMLGNDSGLLDSYVTSKFDAVRDELQDAIDDKADWASDADAIGEWVNATGNAFLVVSTSDGDIIYPATIDGSIGGSDSEASGDLTSGDLTSTAADDGAYYEEGGYGDSDYVIAGRAAGDEVNYVDYCETRINLSDGRPAHVYLYGSYSHTFRMMLTAAAVALSVLVFFILFLLGIRRRMVYIKKLEAEVSCMGGGDLSEPISVEGDDELASLARQIDEMRVSLAGQIAAEQRALEANRDLVTTMSHDLRTPLTSLLLYAQILKDGRYEGVDQMQGYLDKIYERAMHIKRLSDSLFHQFLVGEEDEADRTESPLGIVMGDLLSGMVSSLEASGISVQVTGDLTGADWPVDVERVSRVIDNLLSNMLKYADAASPVAIDMGCDEGAVPLSQGVCQENRPPVAPQDTPPVTPRVTRFTVRFANAVAEHPAQEESTGIGLANVKRLMSELGGAIEAGKTDGKTYVTTLVFPRGT